MRAAWAAGMVISIVACHRAPQVQPWPVRELGDYSYRISGTSLYGKFTILDDRVSMDAQTQSCRRVGTETNNQEVHPFRCVGGSTAFNVYVNTRRPEQSTWSTMKAVKKTVEVCTEYAYTISGERVCSKSRSEVKTVTEGSSGILDVTRIASAEKP
jgi:hypothetical protein